MDIYHMAYIGDGNYWQGVPARDLSALEWEALSVDDRATVLSLGLYEERSGPVPQLEPQENDNAN